MGFWAAAIPALISVAGSLLTSKKSGGGGSAQLQQQSGIETQLLQRQRDIIDQLFEMAQGFDPTPMGALNLPDSPFLDEEFLGGLRPQGDIELLKFLAGASDAGNAATLGVSDIEQRRRELSEAAQQQQGQAIAGVIDSLLQMRNNNQGNPSTQPTPTEVLNNYVDPTGIVDTSSYQDYPL